MLVKLMLLLMDRNALLHLPVDTNLNAHLRQKRLSLTFPIHTWANMEPIRSLRMLIKKDFETQESRW
jgi:hypothetical protein